MLRSVSVVRAALLGEAIRRCRAVVLVLLCVVTSLVLSIALAINAWVALGVSFIVIVVLANVLTTVKMHVGLSLDIVAMVLRRLLGMMIIWFIEFRRVEAQLRRCLA